MAGLSLERSPMATGLSIPEPQVTLLLNRWVKGDEAALNELASHDYRELRRTSRSYLRRWSGAFTLRTVTIFLRQSLSVHCGPSPSPAQNQEEDMAKLFC